jgi:Tlde1 domain
MARGIDRGLDFIPRERGHLFSRIFSQTLPGVVALALSALFGVWILYLRPADAPHAVEAPAAKPALALASNPYGRLSNPRSFSGSTPVSLAKSFPLEFNLKPIPPAPSAAIAEQENVLPAPAGAQFGASAPLPVPRPTELGSLESHSPFPASGRRLAQQNGRNGRNGRTVPPATPSDTRTFFEKLFGMRQPSGPVLAYAAPESGGLGNARSLTSRPSPRYDRWTAVYDVAAHTVYMPNGTRLEAHSGLHDRLDDPRHVNERMRGATPPNVYELAPREQLFHGVQALRLKPVGSGDIFGRAGLLAHTYMLGPNGDSNGCVSFKDYNAFLQAFQNGEVKRLVVVARLD